MHFGQFERAAAASAVAGAHPTAKEPKPPWSASSSLWKKVVCQTGFGQFVAESNERTPGLANQAGLRLLPLVN